MKVTLFIIYSIAPKIGFLPGKILKSEIAVDDFLAKNLSVVLFDIINNVSGIRRG